MHRCSPLLILLASCGASESPDQVVVAFMEALRKGDESWVVSCLHPESPLLTQSERWRDAAQRKSYLEGASRMLRKSRAEVKILDVNSGPNDARVDFRVFSPDPGWDAVDYTFYLRRFEGQWRIDHGAQWESYFPRLRAEAK